MKSVYDFLKQAGVFFLATSDRGAPRLRPFGFVMIYEGKLWLCTNCKKEVSRQLKENPQLELCACVGTHWLRLQANAVFSNDLKAKEQVFWEDSSMKNLYTAEDPIFEVFYLKDAVAFWDGMDGSHKETKL